MEGSVRSVLYLHAKDGKHAAVVEHFRSERVFEQSRESGGFQGASLNVPISGQGPILVLATWRDEADYQRWLASPVRAAMTPSLAALLEKEPVAGEMYSIEHELPA